MACKTVINPEWKQAETLCFSCHIFKGVIKGVIEAIEFTFPRLSKASKKVWLEPIKQLLNKFNEYEATKVSN